MNLKRLYSTCLLSLFLVSFLHVSSGQEDDEVVADDSEPDFTAVTCGSAIKLKHTATGARLHSHVVTYGSGSGQQSVTGYPHIDDSNSLWMVRGAHSKRCTPGKVIKAGDIIRLQHMTTGRNLHSHLHRSPLTGQQEVSCFGEGGEGDTGDNWKIVVDSGSVWKRGQPVRFEHADTGKWLSSNRNTFGNPIPGQQEVCSIGPKNRDTEWSAEEGYYLPASK